MSKDNFGLFITNPAIKESLVPGECKDICQQLYIDIIDR